MKRGRTKRRIARSRFEEKKCEIPIIGEGGLYFIKVTAQILGEWGYHGDLWNIEGKQERIWTVFHAPSGFKIWSINNEKEAKIAVKRLHHKAEGRWDLTEEEKYQFHRWYSSVFDIVSNHMRSENLQAVLLRDKISPSQYYDDIPF